MACWAHDSVGTAPNLTEIHCIGGLEQGAALKIESEKILLLHIE